MSGWSQLQNPHVGPPPAPSLDDDAGGGIEDAHEGDGARGLALGRPDEIPPGAQVREAETRAAAGLVDLGHVVKGREDPVDGIPHGQDETGRELAQGRARVHEGRRVGQERELAHHVIEGLFGLRGRDGRFEILLPPGHVVGHPAQQLARRFGDVALVVLDEVALFQDFHGVDGELEVVFETQGRLGLAHLRAALAVEDVGPGDGTVTRLHEALLDEVLDGLDAGCRFPVEAACVGQDGVGHRLGDGDRLQAVLEDLEGRPLDGIADLFLFEGDDGAVALADLPGKDELRHGALHWVRLR